MLVIPDFKTEKLNAEFRKAFGRKFKLPKSALKLLSANLSAVVNGPATSIVGHPERGLIVKVMSSATGERIIHQLRLDGYLNVAEHTEQKIGQPSETATVDYGEFSVKARPREPNVRQDGKLIGKGETLR